MQPGYPYTAGCSPQFSGPLPVKKTALKWNLALKTGCGGGIKSSICHTAEKKHPVPEEYEMYNLTTDPLETKNLADPSCSTPESRSMQQKMEVILAEQRCKKRLAPSSGAVQGMPPNCPGHKAKP